MSSRFFRSFVAGALACGTLALLGVGVTANAASAQSGGTEHFTIVSTSNFGQGPGPVVATGVFNEVGTDHQGSNVDTLVFPNGSFKAEHDLPGGTQHFSFDPLTCTATFTGSNLPILINRGTGAFVGISGEGTANVKSVQITQRTANGCTDTPVAGYTIIHATASIFFDL